MLWREFLAGTLTTTQRKSRSGKRGDGCVGIGCCSGLLWRGDVKRVRLRLGVTEGEPSSTPLCSSRVESLPEETYKPLSCGSMKVWAKRSSDGRVPSRRLIIGQANKGARRMPRRREPMKDVASDEMPRGAASRL
jgi:hypothetical protein